MTELDKVFIELMMSGRYQEADLIARQVTERFKEDPTTGAVPIDTGACHFCGFVFGEHDCQHEVGTRIACDTCYLERRTIRIHIQREEGAHDAS